LECNSSPNSQTSTDVQQNHPNLRASPIPTPSSSRTLSDTSEQQPNRSSYDAQDLQHFSDRLTSLSETIERLRNLLSFRERALNSTSEQLSSQTSSTASNVSSNLGRLYEQPSFAASYFAINPGQVSSQTSSTASNVGSSLGRLYEQPSFAASYFKINSGQVNLDPSSNARDVTYAFRMHLNELSVVNNNLEWFFNQTSSSAPSVTNSAIIL
ncbi:hypothetical protein BgiBS90_027387, partial [Biomphalaria glabrata]